LYLIFSKLF